MEAFSDIFGNIGIALAHTEGTSTSHSGHIGHPRSLSDSTSANGKEILGIAKPHEVTVASQFLIEEKNVSSSSEDEEMSSVSMEAPEALLSPNDSRISTAGSHAAESADVSLDSDLLSMSDSSEDIEPLSYNNPAVPVLHAVALRLISGFRAAAHSGGSTSENPEKPVTPRSSNGVSSAAGPPRTSRKRKCAQEDGADSDDDAFLRPPPKRAKQGPGQQRHRLLACPYWKSNPERHRCCFAKKLSRIRDVKQHLSRKHTPQFYCDRCSKIFQDEQSLQEHVASVAGLFCTPSTALDGISHRQRWQLARKSNPKLSEEEQWFAIWDILFARRPRPNSAYMDSDISEDLCSFREYWRNHGEAFLAQELQGNGHGARAEISDDERRRYLWRIVADASDVLYEQWRSSRSSDSGRSQDLSSNRESSRLQSVQYETPAGSFADSGVVLQTQPPTSDFQPDNLPAITEEAMRQQAASENQPHITPAERGRAPQDDNYNFPNTLDDFSMEALRRSGEQDQAGGLFTEDVYNSGIFDFSTSHDFGIVPEFLQLGSPGREHQIYQPRAQGTE